MKKSIITFIISAAVFTACKKDPAAVSTIVNVTYPKITLNGPPVVHIPVGGTYVDQGAVLTDDITGAQSAISPLESDLDASTPGMYKVLYQAANANGFRTKAIRTILVLNYTPPAGLDPNFDISGVWVRTNGIVTNLYKMDNGLYVMDNFAGSTTVYPAYMLTPDTNSIDIPAQTTFDGFPIDVNSEALFGHPPNKFSFRVSAENFGTGVRTFNKQ